MRRALPCLIALALVLTVAVRVDANDIPGPPDAPCHLSERLNIHIVDGWLYECGCSVLATGFHCEWTLVGQVEEANAIRRPKKARRAIVRYALPGVTA